MQHIVHIFIGDELVSFRDRFASIFRTLNPDIEPTYFTALSLTADPDGSLLIQPDDSGESADCTAIKDNHDIGLYNFFDDLYSRKVTVAHQGNRSIVVTIWCKLYSEQYTDTVVQLIEVLSKCSSKIKIQTEISGFTHDAVSCFIPNPKERFEAGVYKECFNNNIAKLRSRRSDLTAFRLIANRNIQGVSLNFTEDALARVCAEYSALQCRHYLEIRPAIIDSRSYPFESYGISSIKFDRHYYHDYIRKHIIIDKIRQEGIDDRRFNINALAQTSDPAIRSTLDEIRKFHSEQAVNKRAALALKDNDGESAVVAAIDKELNDIVARLRENIDNLVKSGKINIFESEALLSLILGDDCAMFDTSAVKADEIIIDDIIDESARFFVGLDPDNKRLHDVPLDDIKKIRSQMRNIAVANRQREERLKALDINRKDAADVKQHIDGDTYHFGDVGYKLDLDIDNEPLETTYKAHAVKVESVDLRNLFRPIRNQGSQGCCASFAIASVIEALAGNNTVYSPAFLYWNARDVHGDTNTDSGATMYDVIKAATEKGVSPEALMPYNPDSFSVRPSGEALTEALNCKVVEAQTVDTKLDDIKSALSDGFPVVIAARIFDSFSDTNSGFVHHPSNDEIANGERSDGHGHHAMVVCGFSDKERVFVVRNSWGKEFGDNGYCYIPYSYADKYFLQACIVTQISLSEKKRTADTPHTLDFNTSDNSIQAAILQNLIDEDNFELNRLKVVSDQLKTLWAHNIGVLGNVNNQTRLVEEAKDDLQASIDDQKIVIRDLGQSMDGKLKEFGKAHIYRILCSLIATVFLAAITIPLWMYVAEINTLTIATSIVTGIAALITSYLACTYGWERKKHRQLLRDEIEKHSDLIDFLKAQKLSLGIKAHIHGKILNNIGNYKLSIQSDTNRLRRFNADIVDLYNRTNKELAEMSPAVPYPFRAVLSNSLLDRYYDIWKDKMTLAFDIKDLLDSYTKDADLAKLLNDNKPLQDAIMRGLKGFGMREYISRSNPAKWQFLPDKTDLSEVLPDIDSRAIPFCPYDLGTDNNEKYIFIKDITQSDMPSLAPYFQQAPMPIATNDPDSITVLNTVRYDIEPTS